ncbi:MAG: hypothetical protein ACM3QZ_10765 [Solirubrobacterales bacterium]
MRFWVYFVGKKAGGRWVNAIDMDRARDIFAAQEGTKVSNCIGASKKAPEGSPEP